MVVFVVFGLGIDIKLILWGVKFSDVRCIQRHEMQKKILPPIQFFISILTTSRKMSDRKLQIGVEKIMFHQAIVNYSIKFICCLKMYSYFLKNTLLAINLEIRQNSAGGTHIKILQNVAPKSQYFSFLSETEMDVIAIFILMRR